MNKFSVLLAAVCSAAILLSGCSDKDNDGSNSSMSTAGTTAELASSAEVTEPPVIERDIEPAEGTYIYDNAGILSADAVSECNNYCEWLYENYLINAAVVTTSSLGEHSPEEYAANAYIDIYEGKGSGLLLLINNDTNKDYLYKTGSCINSIDEETENEAFYWATREIVSGDYKTAILRLMQLGELCPQYVFDNGGIFTDEQINSLEALCSESPSDFTVLATVNSTESTNEEICRTYYHRHYKDHFGFMVMVDTVSNTVFVMKDGKVVVDLGNGVLESANQLAASGDYYGAVNAIITS